VPFDIEGAFVKYFFMHAVLLPVSQYLLTLSTPLGRKAKPVFLTRSGPLVRTKRAHLRAAGVEFLPRMFAVREGQPAMEDGRVVEPANVIWCTGYQSRFEWIDLPIHGELEPKHERGVVPGYPGLYFVGLKFLYAASSSMLLGVTRDAKRIVETIA
jgi:putative flavoprotein involved in K+ transport